MTPTAYRSMPRWAGPLQNLGCDVGQGAGDAGAFLDKLLAHGQAEVHQLDLRAQGAAGGQRILRLDVAVEDAAAMQVGQRLQGCSSTWILSLREAWAVASRRVWDSRSSSIG